MTTYLHGSYLSLRDVSVTYAGGYQALQPTNLDVAKGEILVLLGPSGAGKSTLLRSINRLVTASTGTITLADLPAKSSASKQLRQLRRQCAMVFQQHHLIGRQTVLSNVLMGLLATRGPLTSVWPWSREDKFKALAAIDRVGLLDKALTRADMLSGGQQQRVGIARALVQAPRVLLADEVELAQSFADRIVGLRQGAVVFDASPDQLKPEVLARLYSGATLNSSEIDDGLSSHRFQPIPPFVSQKKEVQPC
jgi:phosphonate transport system ATP-binding protein